MLKSVNILGFDVGFVFFCYFFHFIKIFEAAPALGSTGESYSHTREKQAARPWYAATPVSKSQPAPCSYVSI